jgi:hypothetical protein
MKGQNGSAFPAGYNQCKKYVVTESDKKFNLGPWKPNIEGLKSKVIAETASN